MKTVFDITPENAFEPELRALYLGATDVTALLCLNNYTSPYELWLEKTGQAAPKILTEEQEDLFWWGHALEPIIVQRWIEKNPDWEVVSANAFVIDSEHQFLCKNTDREIRNKKTGEIAILEAKTVASSAFKHWKLGVPLNYYTQGQDYLGVYGYDRVFFALFIMDARDLKTFEVLRDDAYIGEIRDLSVKFWNENVLARVAPDKTVYDFASTHATDESITSTPEIELAITQLKSAKLDKKRIEETIEALEEPIKLFLGEKSIIVSAADTKTKLVTWNGSDTTRAVGVKVIKEVAPDLLDQLTKTSYSRTLLIK